MHDLVVSGGTVHDGLGGPGRVADVAVNGGRVTAVGTGLGAARRVLDAGGLVVAPGFIDPHSHSDMHEEYPASTDPIKLFQGVTTEILGNCGFSPPDFTGYMDKLDGTPLVANACVLVGHNTLREAANGMGTALRPGALERMCEAADEAFAAGAVGISSGLEYAPGAYGDTGELVALATVAHKWRRIYTTHMRNEGEGLIAAVDEALEIARRARVRLQVSHCKASGPRAHGLSLVVLKRLRAARIAGIDVLGDIYPYTACSTGLAAVLPAIALEGGEESLLKRLADPAERAALRTIAEHPDEWYGAGIWRETTPEDILIVEHKDGSLLGRTLGDIAGGRDPWEVLCDVVAADPEAATVLTTMSEDDLLSFLADPLIGVGSDGGLTTPLGHPRTWGTFPRYLGRYVRDKQALPLAEAVRRMTSLTATHFGLTGRGWIGVGGHADLCVFDPATIGHEGTFTEPGIRPTGVQHVVMAGKVAVADGEFAGERHGRLIRAA
ncbi:N-acyl-D-amino-acid deacylase family protein [Sinosporangium siamense]|uniref:N-acyl-D-amino-acid deacylase n=1 Tax=Sinosporangium siamense TaxID=1367973 RepID=A0A919RNT7_9ACTN|nr:amidohydrolase family protein [Sinosporangium siamense]GII95409.1 N-acyl-D-amino-acid deacylase [Sinosporangium siamense]